VSIPAGAERSGGRDDHVGYRVLLGLGATILVVAGLKAGAGVFQPVVFALFLGVLSLPLFAWLRQRRWPLPLAVAATMLVIVAVVGSFVLLLLGSLGEVKQVGPTYARVIQERVSYTVEWWRAKGIDLGEWIPESVRDGKALFGLAGGTLKWFLEFLSAATISLLALVFLLFEFATFPEKLTAAPAHVQVGFARFRQVSFQLQRYVLIKTVMSSLIGVSAALWVGYLDVDFAVLLGLIAFGAHFIPNVGALIAAAPAMLFAFVQYDVMKSLTVGVGYLVLGTALGNLVEPALMGHRLGLSPLVVFLSLVAWGWIWGPVGMFLSVPLTLTVKILLAHNRRWAWLAALVDSDPPAPAAPLPDGAEPALPPVGAEGVDSSAAGPAVAAPALATSPGAASRDVYRP
jgi:predicted PurR-regulated permease PerM